MNWLDKVKELKKQKTNNIFIDARFRENLWEAGEIVEPITPTRSGSLNMNRSKRIDVTFLPVKQV
jgi:hypothetical protein